MTLADLKRLVIGRDLAVNELVTFVLGTALMRARTGEVCPRRGIGQRVTRYELAAMYPLRDSGRFQPARARSCSGWLVAPWRRALNPARFRKVRDAFDREFAQRAARRSHMLSLRRAMG